MEIDYGPIMAVGENRFGGFALTPEAIRDRAGPDVRKVNREERLAISVVSLVGGPFSRIFRGLCRRPPGRRLF